MNTQHIFPNINVLATPPPPPAPQTQTPPYLTSTNASRLARLAFAYYEARQDRSEGEWSAAAQIN